MGAHLPTAKGRSHGRRSADTNPAAGATIVSRVGTVSRVVTAVGTARVAVVFTPVPVVVVAADPAVSVSGR